MNVVLRRVSILFFAIASLSCAFGQKTQNYEALLQKGKAQLQAGSADQALASGEQAIKIDVARWEGYALAGGALMNLKQYEKAADMFSHAIDRAPEAKQAGLRDLRKQCLLAEAGATAAPKPTAPATTEAEIVLWKSIENSTNPADFQAYLDQYPNGAFVPLARQRMQGVREQQTQQQQQQQQQQKQALANLTWTDLRTGLIWTRQSSPSEFDSDRPQKADEYCTGLNLAGLSDWRMATLDELRQIYDPSANVSGFHIMGGIRLSGMWVMSSAMLQVDRGSLRFDRGEKGVGRYAFGYPRGGYGKSYVLCVRRMRPDEVAQAYANAATGDPKNASSQVGWGAMLLRQGKPADAITHLEKALAIDGRNAAAYAVWGDALLAQNDNGGAATKYKKAIELDPQNEPAYLGLGEVLRNQGNFADALTQYSKAADLDPFDPAPHVGWGEALLAQRNPDKAIAEYRKAVEVDGRSSRAWSGWGDALSQKGKKKDAQAAYQRALKEDGSNEDAKTKLAELTGQGGREKKR